jgi:peroxiredoxin
LLALLPALALALACGGAGTDSADGTSSEAASQDAGADGAPETAGNPWIGQEFPAFSATDCDGAPVALEDFRGQHPALWLTLHDGFCSTCLEQHDFLNTFYAEYRQRGVEVLLILGDDAQASGHVTNQFCRDFTTYAGFQFPVLKDDGFNHLGPFSGSQTPVQVLLDRNLTVRALRAGWDEPFDAQWVTTQVQTLLIARGER